MRSPGSSARRPRGVRRQPRAAQGEDWRRCRDSGGCVFAGDRSDIMVASLLAVETLWRRELIRFWRQKSRVLGVVASPLIFWAVIGFGMGADGPKFFFPGTVVLTVMFSAIFSTMSIIEDRREGFLLSMLVSPASRTSLVLGKIRSEE